MDENGSFGKGQREREPKRRGTTNEASAPLRGNLIPEYSRWSVSRTLIFTCHIIIFFAEGSVFAKNMNNGKKQG